MARSRLTNSLREVSLKNQNPDDRGGDGQVTCFRYLRAKEVRQLREAEAEAEAAAQVRPHDRALARLQ